MRICTRPPRRGRGFTVIELLVVIAIIAVLAGLTTAAVAKFMQVGPRRATDATLSAASSKLSAQWKAVLDDANRAPLPSNFTNRQAYIQARLAQAFPQNFSEALNPPGGLGAWPAYLLYLGANPGTTSPAGFESSVCLMMILDKGPQNTGAGPDVFSPNVTTQVNLGNGTSVKALTDGWKNSVALTRGSNGCTLTSTGGPKGPPITRP